MRWAEATACLGSSLVEFKNVKYGLTKTCSEIGSLSRERSLIIGGRGAINWDSPRFVGQAPLSIAGHGRRILGPSTGNEGTNGTRKGDLFPTISFCRQRLPRSFLFICDGRSAARCRRCRGGMVFLAVVAFGVTREAATAGARQIPLRTLRPLHQSRPIRVMRKPTFKRLANPWRRRKKRSSPEPGQDPL